MATFLDVVNKVMVDEGIISGDDDEITTFSSSQHVASIRLAQRAVKLELAELVSDEVLPYERSDAILTVSGRTANLSSDFVRFEDEKPRLVETDAAGTSQGNWIWEYPGGEEKLRYIDFNYRENTGKPTFWYWVGGSAKTVGFYTVPTETYYYRYYYEKDVAVAVESDTVPFVTATEVEVFTAAASRRFKYLYASPVLREQLFPKGLEEDALILGKRRTLIQLLRHKQPAKRYGRSYLGPGYCNRPGLFERRRCW